MIRYINRIAIPIACILPALIFFLLGETVSGIIKIYLIPIILFLTGFSLVGWKNLKILDIVIYSVSVGIVLVGSISFIAAFIHHPYSRLISTIILFALAAWGGVNLLRSRLISNSHLRSVDKHLSEHYYFLVLIPIFFAILHYSIFEVSFTRFPIPVEKIIQKLPISQSHKERIFDIAKEKFVYSARYGDTIYYLSKAGIIDKSGLPIQNPTYIQASSDPLYSSKYQFMRHYMTPTYWVGLHHLSGLTIIQASKASAIFSYIIIFSIIYRISTFIGLNRNKSLFAGSASILWGTMGGFVFCFLGLDPYLGNGEGGAFSGAFYHSPTQLHSTAIGLVGLAMVIHYYDKRNPKLLCLAAFLLGSSIHFKPSFITIALFSLVILFLITKQYRFPEWYISGLIIAIFLVMWVLPRYFYSLSSSSISMEFKPLHWLLFITSGKSWTEAITISVEYLILMVLAFGIFILALVWTIKHIRRDDISFPNARIAYIITAVSMFLFGFFESLCLCETGKRYLHGNSYWALYSAMAYSIPFVFYFCVSLSSRKLRAIIGIAISLHLLSGTIYALAYPRLSMQSVYIDDAMKLSELNKTLKSDARGLLLNNNGMIEYYTGVPCSSLDLKTLDENLEKIRPDFVAFDRDDASNSNPSKIPEFYSLFYQSKVSGLEIWLRSDYSYVQ